MGKILSGSLLAEEIKDDLKKEVEGLVKKGVRPRLTVLLVGQDPASVIYVRNKEKAAKNIGIESVVERFDEGTDQSVILNKINELNIDKANHGILVQRPLPPHLEEMLLLETINPLKDVDGSHFNNMGKLLSGRPALRPCTPSGIIRLIESTKVPIAGKKALIIGRSNIVGKPAALMLLEKNATVTIAHSKTADLDKIVQGSDIVVAAIGRPGFIKGEWIKKGAIVIDVGINRMPDGSLMGDVEFESALKKASFITPVPGGVGPMTIAMLLKNTLEAAKSASKK